MRLVILWSCLAAISVSMSMLKQALFRPNCNHFLLSPHYDRLLSKQLSLTKAVRDEMPDWQGGPHFTIAHVRTAAQLMHRVNTDSEHRRLIVRTTHDNSIYIAFKFFIPKKRHSESLLTNRLVAYKIMKAHWAVIKRAIQMHHGSTPIILTGFGTGGQVAVLTALQIIASLHNPTRVITFDDEAVFIKDPDSDKVLSRLEHLRFVSGTTPTTGGCEEELLISGANQVVMPKERFMSRLTNQCRSLGTIDYALYFSPFDLQPDEPLSVGQFENTVINDLLQKSFAHSSLAVPVYSATGHLLMTERAHEAARVLTRHLNHQLHSNQFRCSASLPSFSTVHSPFSISCRIGETTTVFDYSCQLAFNPSQVRNHSAWLLNHQVMYQSGAPSEQCVLALRAGSVGIREFLFDAHKLLIDEDRMTAVVVPQRPLVVGTQLLDKNLLSPLLSPTDPFPRRCAELIQGVKARRVDPKLWSTVRAFLRTLPLHHPDDKMFVGKLACKRDTQLFRVHRTSFSLDSWETVRVRMSRVRQCIATQPVIDCRDPLNHWIRPSRCPRRCLRSSVSLCDQVISCPISTDMNMFIAVEPRPFQWVPGGGWLGRLDGRVKASKQDRYVAFHVKALKSGFGWWDWASEFHLLMSFE